MLCKKNSVFIIISGLAFAIPYHFPQLWFLSWFALIPYIFALYKAANEGRPKRALNYGIIFGLSFYLPVYIWFLWLYPLDFAGLTSAQSMIVAGGAWILFSVLQTLVHLILPAGFYFLRKTSPRLMPLVFASLWVIVEHAQTYAFSGFPWARVAISQYTNIIGLQSISVFGSLFTGFIVLLVNTSLAMMLNSALGRPQGSALQEKFDSQARRITYKDKCYFLILALTVFLINDYFGILRLAFFPASERTVNAVIVQGNISSYEKWAGSPSNCLRVYTGLTRDHHLYILENHPGLMPDIYVWPETAITTSLNQTAFGSAVASLSDDLRTPILLGAFYSCGDRLYNSLYAAIGGELYADPYHKQHLVPFGEYLPLRGLLSHIPFVADINMLANDISAGECSALFDINGVRYGGLICFDSIFPRLARRSVLDGAEILVVVTNDSWYKDSVGVYQHNAHSVLRALENGRTVIRAANTGISSFISPTGRIYASLGVYQRGTLSAHADVRTALTLYTILGDIIVWFSLGMIVVIFFKSRAKCVIIKENKRKQEIS